jgi:hypothetical protein
VRVNPILPPCFPLIQIVVRLAYLGLIPLGFFALSWVVGAAVRRALRDHQLWLEFGGNGNAP